MRSLLLALSVWLSLCCAVSAQGVPNTGSPMVPNGGGGGATAGFVTCSAGVCTFTGADGSTQMVVGTTNSAVDYLQVLGGVAGGGATMNCTSASDTNVACNFTAKGNGAVTFNNGHGNLGTFVDPGSSVSTNGGAQITPSISNGPVKFGNSTYGANIDGGTNQIYQVGGQPFYTDFPGYIASNWYVGYGPQAVLTGAAPGAGSIRLYPAYIKQRMTINNLGTRITTASAGGNIQLAIYANNAATMQPTGNALVSTASISTTATGSLNAAASVQLNPGLYWFASNCDNGTAVMVSVSQTMTWIAQSIGSSAQNAAIGNSVALNGLSFAQTFGTWPSLTAASFVAIVGGNSVPVVQFEVASVP